LPVRRMRRSAPRFVAKLDRRECRDEITRCATALRVVIFTEHVPFRYRAICCFGSGRDKRPRLRASRERWHRRYLGGRNATRRLVLVPEHRPEVLSDRSPGLAFAVAAEPLAAR